MAACCQIYDCQLPRDWINAHIGYLFRVATNLENLEKSGVFLNVENSGNSWGILCNLREKL